MRYKGNDLTFLMSQWFFWNAMSINLLFRSKYTSELNFNSISSCGEILDANVCSKECLDFSRVPVILLKCHGYKLVVSVSIHVWVKFQLNIFIWWDSRSKCRFHGMSWLYLCPSDFFEMSWGETCCLGLNTSLSQISTQYLHLVRF